MGHPVLILFNVFNQHFSDPDFPDGGRGAHMVEVGRVGERHDHKDRDYACVDGKVLLVSDVVWEVVVVVGSVGCVDGDCLRVDLGGLVGS